MMEHVHLAQRESTKPQQGTEACQDMSSPYESTCNAGFAFSSASAGSDLIGALANDGACTPCAAGRYKNTPGDHEGVI